MKRALTITATLAFATPALADDTTTTEEWQDPGALKPALEMDFGLRGVTSINGVSSYSDANSSGNAVGVVDFSDTLAYARGRTALANGGRAGTLVAVTFPDTYYEPGTLFLAEANAFYEDKWITARIGRARMRSQIFRMPTLRDDDLIRFTDAQNPFSLGTSTADHQYGNTADLSFWPTPRVYIDAHTENMPTSLRPPGVSQFAINSYGLTLGYRQIAAEVPMSILRHIGVGANVYNIDQEGQRFTWQALGGAWLNVIVDPVHLVDLRVHGIFQRGVRNAGFASLADTFRTRQVSASAAIGYTYRKMLLPAFRTHLVGAYKRYLDDGIDQYSIIANAFIATGMTSEIGLQYQFRNRASRVPEAFGDDFAHSIKVAFVVSLETSTGVAFDSRESLLNTEAGYLP